MATTTIKFGFQLGDPTDTFDNDKYLKGNFQKVEDNVYMKTETVSTPSTVQRMEIVQVFFFTNGGSTNATASGTFAKPFTTAPKIMPMNIDSGTNIPFSDVILYPNITAVTTTGFTVKITAQGGNLGTSGTPANIVMNFMVVGN